MSDTLNDSLLNAQCLAKEYQWFKEVLALRFQLYFKQETIQTDIRELSPPNLENDFSKYGNTIKQHELGFEERICILLALAPHVQPNALDLFFTQNTTYNRGFTEFGGVSGNQHTGFLPTVETLCFILAGEHLHLRFQTMQMLAAHEFLIKFGIIRIGRENGKPFLGCQLLITPEFLQSFTSGEKYKPGFSSDFPAQKIETPLEWNDLVLDVGTREDISEMITWIEHKKNTLQEWQLFKNVKPGYRALFYGPPGTGKTLTTSLIGKKCGMEVYRVDLSQIVSKYIGETEKNLANIFNQAEHKDWVLFFDEADALFGKRGGGGDAKDRYANQEIAYLLQRIESFDGLVILATNLKGNMDDAFARRFQAMIYFPMPTTEQRLQLWESAFAHCPLSADCDFAEIAENYKISGGSINNVLLSCALQASRRAEPIIMQEDIVKAIKKEFKKEGRTI